MGSGFSLSQNTAEQLASSSVAQNFTGTCDIQCQNIASGTTIDIQDSTIRGGINFTQSCSATGDCLFSTTQNAAIDSMFFAKNSAQAKNAGSWLSGFLNNDIATNTSYQDIRQDINQSIEDHCKISSLNDIDRLTILATNSDISGGIDISQQGDVNGSCAMQANFVGSATATGSIEQSASSGKKVGKKSGKGMIILIVLAVIAVIVIGVIIFVIFRHKGDPICPGGVKAVKPSRFGKAVCPPSLATTSV
nr:transmembrane domain containing protein [Marseillevirus futianmevirus]